MKAAGIYGFPVVLLCLVIVFGGDFSTMIPCTAGSARYIYTSALDGCFPAVFSIVAYAVLMVLAVDRHAIWYNLALSGLCVVYLVFGFLASGK